MKNILINKIILQQVACAYLLQDSIEDFEIYCQKFYETLKNRSGEIAAILKMVNTKNKKK